MLKLNRAVNIPELCYNLILDDWVLFLIDGDGQVLCIENNVKFNIKGKTIGISKEIATPIIRTGFAEKFVLQSSNDLTLTGIVGEDLMVHSQTFNTGSYLIVSHMNINIGEEL